MNTHFKKSMVTMLALVLLGIAALLAGPKWLLLLIPAATLVWYTAKPGLRDGRN